MMNTSVLFKAPAIIEILAGLCIYNVGVAIVFVIVGTSGGMNGILLWPTAIPHAVIGAMMLWIILAAPYNEQS